MRNKRTVQTSIFETYPDHQIGHELKAISQWLDKHFDLLDGEALQNTTRPVVIARFAQGLASELKSLCVKHAYTESVNALTLMRDTFVWKSCNRRVVLWHIECPR